MLSALFLALSLRLSLTTTTAADVTLAWDKSTSSNVVAYRIYYGKTPGAYTQFVQVANTNHATVVGLTSSTPYYFAATALDAQGLESLYSNEINYVTPLARIPLSYRQTTQKWPVISGTGPASSSYSIEASTNLVNWAALASVTVGTNGTFEYIDANATNFARRFYRVRSLAPN